MKNPEEEEKMPPPIKRDLLSKRIKKPEDLEKRRCPKVT